MHPNEVGEVLVRDSALRNVQHKWATFSREILRLTKTIFKQLQNTGMFVEEIEEYSKRLTEYDGFLSLNMDHLMMERQTTPARPVEGQKQVIQPIETDFSPLDFGKVKGFLLADSPGLEDVLITILKSLRRRLMRGQTMNNMNNRKQLHLFVMADLWNMSSTKPVEERVFHRVLTHKNPDIRAEGLKLIHVMCSSTQGRNYIAQSMSFITIVINILKQEQADTKVRRRAVGIMQNLSLRKKVHTQMVNLQMIETCFQILKDEQETLCTYSLNYFTALLLNLLLRKEGRERCETIEIDIFQVLENLLASESSMVKTFCNMIIISVIPSAVLRKKFVESKFFERLRAMKQNLGDWNAKQIDYITNLMEMDSEQAMATIEDFNENHEYKDEEDQNCFEEDISDGKLLVNIDEDDVGELFLKQSFGASEEQIQQQKQLLKDMKEPTHTKGSGHQMNEHSPEQVSPNKPLQRCATPSMMMERNLTSRTGRNSTFGKTSKVEVKMFSAAQESLKQQNHANSTESYKGMVQGNQDTVKPDEASFATPDEHQIGFESRPRISRTPLTDAYQDPDKV